jgi:hypothetical protein
LGLERDDGRQLRRAILAQTKNAVYVASADALYVALLDEMDKTLKRLAVAQKN